MSPSGNSPESSPRLIAALDSASLFHLPLTICTTVLISTTPDFQNRHTTLETTLDPIRNPRLLLDHAFIRQPEVILSPRLLRPWQDGQTATLQQTATTVHHLTTNPLATTSNQLISWRT